MSLQYGFDRHSHYGFGIGCGPSRNSYNFDYFSDHYNNDEWDSDDDEDDINFGDNQYSNKLSNKLTDNLSIDIGKILNGKCDIIERYEEMTDEFLMSGIEIEGLSGKKYFILNRNIISIEENFLKDENRSITVIFTGRYSWKTYEPFDSVMNRYRNSISKK